MNAPAEKLTEDVKVLASDLQELLRATTTQSGEKLAAARTRVEGALMHARETVTIQARQAAESADQYVHQNPWQAAGISAAVGLLIGFLAGRR